jgi:hypothetical protein
MVRALGCVEMGPGRRKLHLRIYLALGGTQRDSSPCWCLHKLDNLLPALRRSSCIQIHKPAKDWHKVDQLALSVEHFHSLNPGPDDRLIISSSPYSYSVRRAMSVNCVHYRCVLPSRASFEVMPALSNRQFSHCSCAVQQCLVNPNRPFERAYQLPLNPVTPLDDGCMWRVKEASCAVGTAASFRLLSTPPTLSIINQSSLPLVPAHAP